jgi:hypothetical protein
MSQLHQIRVPADCRIIHHEFYTYEPESEFSTEKNKNYLSENLFQCEFPEHHLKIDLGWYGNISTQSGEFRIQLIVNENWEHPFNTIYSKSSSEVKNLLHNIFSYYSSQEFD